MSDFAVGDKVVYSAHGVGEITQIEQHAVGGRTIDFYVISLLGQRMSLKVPVDKAASSGLRSVIPQNAVKRIYDLISIRSADKVGVVIKTSKMKQINNYKQMLNSGNIEDLAVIVRDLYQYDVAKFSYSNKLIYDSALARLTNEIAISTNSQTEETKDQLIELLNKSFANHAVAA